MKTNFLLLLFILSSCIQEKVKQESIIKKIVIESVDLEMDSFFRVSCSNFRSTFEGEIKSHIITDSLDCVLLFNELIKTKSEKSNIEPDVRGVLTIYSDQGESHYCYGKLVVENNGMKYNINPKFIDMVLKIAETGSLR